MLKSIQLSIANAIVGHYDLKGSIESSLTVAVNDLKGLFLSDSMKVEFCFGSCTKPVNTVKLSFIVHHKEKCVRHHHILHRLFF